MDLILRNASLGDGAGTLDIGIADGKVAALSSRLAASAPEIDLGGKLVVPGFIETHLHLDKACILDRCKSEQGTLEEAIAEVSRVKRQFSDDDVFARGEPGPREGDRPRHDARAHARRGRPRHRPHRVRRDQAARRRVPLGGGRRDLRVSAGRAHQLSGDRGADARGAWAGRPGRRRCAVHRPRSARCRSSACSAWRATSTSISTCTSTWAIRPSRWTSSTCAS